MSNIFRDVKENVTARQAAEQYGIKVGRNGMACCPFHNDKHPSMKLDARFHCFGCQVDGDVIDFTARLFGLRNIDAAKKLADDFGVPYDDKAGKGRTRGSLKPVKIKETDEQHFYKTKEKCLNILSSYYTMLGRWEVQYAPKNHGDEWHPLFMEAAGMRAKAGYWLDILLDGTLEEQIELIDDIGWRIKEIDGRLEQFDTGIKGEGTEGSQLYKWAG